MRVMWIIKIMNFDAWQIQGRFNVRQIQPVVRNSVIVLFCCIQSLWNLSRHLHWQYLCQQSIRYHVNESCLTMTLFHNQHKSWLLAINCVDDVDCIGRNGQAPKKELDNWYLKTMRMPLLVSSLLLLSIRWLWWAAML